MDTIMRKLLGLLMLGPISAFAGGFYEFSAPDTPHYVCFDGRRLECSPTGFIWHARRGCFLSRKPCEEYDAHIYGYYPTNKKLIYAYNRCRENYPYRLGEMQTH